MQALTIALVGNPNCGKTTLFNALTGLWQQVGNWSGVTVECKTGELCVDGQQMKIVDLPGTYTLTSIAAEGPEDEALTSDFLKSNQFSCVLNVIDAVNLERNLYLTLQLLEQGLPVVVALNRMDLAEDQGQSICVDTLIKELGCPVIPLVARKGIGIEALKHTLMRTAVVPTFNKVVYPKIIEEELQQLTVNYCQLLSSKVAPRYQLLRWLEGEPVPCALPLASHIQTAQHLILAQSGQEADSLIASSRYQYIEQVVAKARKPHLQKQKRTFQYQHLLDSIICHRVLGFPIFLGVMYALFFFAINVGGAFQDFFEISSDAIFVQGVAWVLQQWDLPFWLYALLVSGVGKGISTILTFVPVLGAMFFALAFLEDSGYMARAAFVMDRLMRIIGLPGKSFVPMIVGFGCNVPAILGARSLDSKRDRILTVMMSPFMSCGARLAIFTVFVAAFFPDGGQNVVFLLYMIGITMAILTGLLLKKTLLKGEITPLLLEMPHYQWPHWLSLFLHSWHRLRRFILNAGKLIIPVCVLIGLANNISLQGKWITQAPEHSALSVLGQKIVPLFKPLGIEKENWPAAVGLFTGILAKEVVIGTLNSLYAEQTQNKEDDFQFKRQISEAFATIPKNFKALGQDWRNPIAASSENEQMSHHAYGEMVKRFNGQANAFAYLLFVLLYFPCISATAAMVREVQKGWTLFSVCWTTGLAYAMAVIYYQCATFVMHPLQSSIWIIIWTGVGIFTFWGIKYYSRYFLPKVLPTPIVLKPT